MGNVLILFVELMLLIDGFAESLLNEMKVPEPEAIEVIPIEAPPE